MIKIDKNIYDRLYAQAEEADDLGFVKLASNLKENLQRLKPEENMVFSSEQLDDNLHKKLWSIAIDTINFYNIKNADALKINETIEFLIPKIIKEIKSSISEDSNVIGSFEPKLPGEE